MKKRSTYLNIEDFTRAKTEQEYLDKVYEVNEDIIGYILNWACIPKNVDITLCQDVLSDALIKAINTYKPMQKSFRKYAFKCMFNALTVFLRQYDSPNRKHIDILDVDTTVSLETYVVTNGNKSYLYKDIASDKSYEDELYSQRHPFPNVENILYLLTDKEQQLIKAVASDRSVEEIAREQGVTRGAIYQGKKRISKKITDCLNLSLSVANLKADGLNSKQISLKLGIPTSEVVKYYKIYQFVYLNIPLSTPLLTH